MLAVVTLVLSLALSAAAATVPDYEDFFAHDACLLGSACPPGFLGPANGTLPTRRNVQLFLRALVGDKEPGREPPHAEDLRVPTSILQQLSTDCKTVTEQNFIDGFYHALDASNGPYPDNVNIVKDYWTYIADCGGIPFKNFANYFVYSSYVKSGGNCQ
ncbi:hypothetical protein K466DRAFT_602852 [Polyporus arcularius HHB13444]|uniref:Uncharacterized protein n=1 Tax=Polyporus arcularius HHB13444 TaxID=1314778 RepID=A0A5C3P3L3_9APHY|nr:hypothetical protein K466DRAFT_602852 [Polyporus arcularius HHB13444]